MRSTKQLSVTLPVEMADAVMGKVSSGEYASESEVIREALRSLIAQDEALEHWLQHKVLGAFRELENDRSRVLTAAQVREHLTQRRASGD